MKKRMHMSRRAGILVVGGGATLAALVGGVRHLWHQHDHRGEMRTEPKE